MSDIQIDAYLVTDHRVLRLVPQDSLKGRQRRGLFALPQAIRELVLEQGRVIRKSWSAVSALIINEMLGLYLCR